ncbi:MBL fold metallo-hydrolase [Aeromicrobium ginsengisoli]|nr:MBL fold metallo-hydrolase [Aeromicrobium ginsengisoli]
MTTTSGVPTSAWTDPGCYEVAPGVHRIPLSMPNDGLRAINVYAIETARGLALIDGGWRVPSALRELTVALAGIRHSPADIHDVYVTHIHRDHYTFAVELRRLFGARVHLGRHEQPGLHEVMAIRTNVPVGSIRDLERAGAPALASDMIDATAAEPFDHDGWELPDSWLDAETLDLGPRELEVVPTPGHTKGHLVFHDHVNRLLFTGDHVLPTITPSIGFELGARELPLQHYLTSLRMLLTRPDARLMPAHGYPADSVHDRVGELLAHHAERFEQAERVVRTLGSGTAADVADRLLWTRRERHFTELDPFNQMMAVCETLAHLDVMVEDGRLAATATPVAIYSAS